MSPIIFFWYAELCIKTWKFVIVKKIQDDNKEQITILLKKFLDINDMRIKEKYTDNILGWKPIMKSDIIIDTKGIKKDRFLSLNLYAENIVAAIIGVKLGGWGINLAKIRIKIEAIKKNLLFI